MRTVFISPSGSSLGGGFFFVSVVQHFDQAIFQLETLMQQRTQLFEFFRNTFPGITQVGERQQLFSNHIDARVTVSANSRPR